MDIETKILAQQNINAQKILCVVALILFIVKIIAWHYTGSVSILTDALESIVNIFSAILGFYSLKISATPKDTNHPYGHGKIEFISAAIEGILIFGAGIFIIYKAIINFNNNHQIQKLDFGILLILISAIVNYLLGSYVIKQGKKNKSMALIASGNHLQTDTYSTIGVIIGLVILYFTNKVWIDSAIAIVFSLAIIYSGIKIIKSAISALMDEQDNELLSDVVNYLDSERIPEWIDLHNLRIIKYGSILHLDCHVTVPWYLNVLEAHEIIQKLDDLIKNKYGKSVEMFVHTDGCLEFSCKICEVENCRERQHNFEKRINWTIQNIAKNTKHKIE